MPPVRVPGRRKARGWQHCPGVTGTFSVLSSISAALLGGVLGHHSGHPDRPQKARGQERAPVHSGTAPRSKRSLDAIHCDATQEAGAMTSIDSGRANVPAGPISSRVFGRVQWAAVIAGAIAAAALAFVLHSVAVGIGLSIGSAAPSWRDASFALVLLSALYLVLTAVAAYGFGGCVRAPARADHCSGGRGGIQGRNARLAGLGL
jgi:hypothetical protein